MLAKLTCLGADKLLQRVGHYFLALLLTTGALSVTAAADEVSPNPATILEMTARELNRWRMSTARLSAIAEAGNAEAQFQLAKRYGYDSNHSKEVEWYRKATSQGHPAATVELAQMYGVGKGVDKDEKEFLRLLFKGAELGDASAQFFIGRSFRDGERMKKDSVQAAKWFRRAAEQESFVTMTRSLLGDARMNLAKMYELGEGVEKSREKAVHWYRRAAECGHVHAQFYDQNLHDNGYGVPKTREEAARIYRKPAEAGDVKAQHLLARIYFHNYGTSNSFALALEWCRKAAASSLP